MSFRSHSPARGRRFPFPRSTMATFVAGTALVLALDTTWWFRAQRALDRHFAEAVAAATGAGWHASARTGERGGWPWTGKVTLRDPQLRIGTGPRWTADRMIVELSPFHRDRIVVDLPGTQTVLLLPLPPLRLWGTHLFLVWHRDRPGRTSFSGDALHVAFGGRGPDDTLRIAAASGQLQRFADGTRLRVAIRDLALPTLLGPPVDGVLPEAHLAVTLPDRPDPIRADVPPRGWRMAGSRIVVEDASLAWNDASAVLSGTAGIDAAGTASGRFRLTVHDPDAILSRLRDAGVIGPGQEIAARAVVDVIGGSGSGSADARSVELDLTLDHGLLLLGRIPLLRLPALPAGP